MEDSHQNPPPKRAASFSSRGVAQPEPVGSPLDPPPDLPADPRSFWGDPSTLERLAVRPEADLPSVLQRLGPLPLPRSGFPLIGFLATVYDHVAASATPPSPPLH